MLGRASRPPASPGGREVGFGFELHLDERWCPRSPGLGGEFWATAAALLQIPVESRAPSLAWQAGPAA